MRQTQFTDGDAQVRRYEYPDRWVLAADLGVADDQVTVDTVGDTAIVVIDRNGTEAETEFDLPGPAADVAVRNGVLTIEVER
ncbi:Hsp20/alpha crystallin family protein [Halopenitus salinus]|jgi:HSP20 family molecular chaperone IbpA|uniref:Hsp20/alpha crystallin family protein n=1 Tax=Halopenitus salinus TaxID=1198295 RepID=A0ABD5UR55_9EURY